MQDTFINKLLFNFSILYISKKPYVKKYWVSTLTFWKYCELKCIFYLFIIIFLK